MENVTEEGVTASAGDMGETLGRRRGGPGAGARVSGVIETDNALYVAVGRELNRSAVVNALFETRIKDAVANAQMDYNTRLYNKLNVGDFYTKLQEARAALS